MCRQRRVCRQSRGAQRPRSPSPSRTCAESDRPRTPSSGQPRSRAGKFELGAHLDDDDQGGPIRRVHREGGKCRTCVTFVREEWLRHWWLRDGRESETSGCTREDTRQKPKSPAKPKKRGQKEIRVTTAGKNRIAISRPNLIW